MATRVWLDGAVTDAAGARVPVFDRGFLYGDSIFEATRTWGGVPLFLSEHLDRLQRSAASVELTPPPRAEIEAATLATLAAANQDPAQGESNLRIIVTRGEGEQGLDPALAGAPRLVVIVREVALPAPELYLTGAKLAVVRRRKDAGRDHSVKSSNYLENLLALAEAKRDGAHEAVMLDGEGRVAEGTTSNLFLVKAGRVVTPDVGVGLLPGITRAEVMDAARGDGIVVEESRPRPADLVAADELFLTSSVRGVLPVTRLEAGGEHRIGDGRPGPVTRRLMALYDARCVRDAAAFRARHG